MAKILFFGTPDYVVPIVQSAKVAGYEIIGVVTQPTKPVGREGKLESSPVAKWAAENNIPVFTPDSLDKNFAKEIAKLSPDVVVLAAYAKLIPPEILKIPKFGCLNIHPSLLPKYRGPSPVQAAIMGGEKQTGVTIIQMDKIHDHGPIVAQFTEDIRDDDTTGTLRARLFEKAAEVLTTILPAYLEGKIELREQDHSKATFTKILTKDDGKIDWKKEPSEIERFIRALSPWPGAWTEVKIMANGQWLMKRLKILKAHLDIDHQSLVIDIVQLEGKNPVSWKQFKEGYPETEFT